MMLPPSNIVTRGEGKMRENRIREMEALIENDKSFLLAQARYIARRPEDAEDLFQETVMKACKHFDHFEPDSNFRAWARKIMLNTHINKRKKKTARPLPLDALHPDLTMAAFTEFSEASCMDNPESVFFRNHISEELMQHFYNLPEEYKTAFSLFHFNGYTYDEVSAALGVPVGTVKSRIHRARQLMLDLVHPARSARLAG